MNAKPGYFKKHSKSLELCRGRVFLSPAAGGVYCSQKCSSLGNKVIWSLDHSAAARAPA